MKADHTVCHRDSKHNAISAVGKTFTRWTVLSVTHEERWMGRLRCSCGVERFSVLKEVLNGKSRSCGCLKREASIRRMTKHGNSSNSGWESRIYRVWKGMRQRCSNPNHIAYINYGGRGIRVCERWQTFSNFLADMGEGSKGLSLDRINNDGMYEPSNCRWATAKEQQQNRRKQKPRRK